MNISTEEGYELWRRDYNCYDPVFVVEMRGKNGRGEGAYIWREQTNIVV